MPSVHEPFCGFNFMFFFHIRHYPLYRVCPFVKLFKIFIEILLIIDSFSIHSVPSWPKTAKFSSCYGKMLLIKYASTRDTQFTFRIHNFIAVVVVLWIVFLFTFVFSLIFSLSFGSVY